MGQLGNVIRGADVEASLSTLWFPNSWRARIVSMFAIGVPVSGVVAAPMSTWIMTRMAGLGGLHGWQWLFLIEGAPAIVLGVIAYFYLRDRPAAARFLTAREKMTIERDLEKEAVGAMWRRIVREGAAQPPGAIVRCAPQAWVRAAGALRAEWRRRSIVASTPAVRQVPYELSGRKKTSHPAVFRLRRREASPGANRIRFCAMCLIVQKLAGA